MHHERLVRLAVEVVANPLQFGFPTDERLLRCPLTGESQMVGTFEVQFLLRPAHLGERGVVRRQVAAPVGVDLLDDDAFEPIQDLATEVVEMGCRDVTGGVLVLVDGPLARRADDRRSAQTAFQLGFQIGQGLPSVVVRGSVVFQVDQVASPWPVGKRIEIDDFPNSRDDVPIRIRLLQGTLPDFLLRRRSLKANARRDCPRRGLVQSLESSGQTRCRERAIDDRPQHELHIDPSGRIPQLPRGIGLVAVVHAVEADFP